MENIILKLAFIVSSLDDFKTKTDLLIVRIFNLKSFSTVEAIVINMSK